MIVPFSTPPLADPSGPLDVAIVGAGAAGIAAGRLCRAMGLNAAIFEARPRVGGRAVTAGFAGHPIDLGAHWLHAGDLNPLVQLGRQRREPMRRANSRGHVVTDGRFGSAADRRQHGQAFERADAAFLRFAREETDRSLARALPPLGRWGGPIASTMALISGRPLEEVSVKDFPSEEFGDNYFIRGGYGAYLSRLAAGLPVSLGCPVSRIDWSGAGIRLETGLGAVSAKAAVVTVPMAVLSAGAIAFSPGLPQATRDAIAGFLPGSYEHAILNWPSAPMRGADRLTKLTLGSRHFGLLSRMDNAPFHYLELDHATVVAARTRNALARLARSVLQASFGSRAVRDLRVLAVTDWRGDPMSLSSWAVVPPGLVGIRAALGEAVGNRIWFAGEAGSGPLWGTVGGAWAEGERAAREIGAMLGN